MAWVPKERSCRDGSLCAGLVLPGGGARGAYQVGVLKAISDFLSDDRNPFPVIVGASVGAINAAAIGCRACDFKAGVKKLVELWLQLQTSNVYRTDLASSIARATYENQLTAVDTAFNFESPFFTVSPTEGGFIDIFSFTPHLDTLGPRR